VDLSEAPAAEREAAAHQLATTELKARFDLEQGPLLRATLVNLGEADWRFYLSAHHIILDGISMYNIFLPELEALYPGLFMRAKHVHGIHSRTSYNRTIHNHHFRSEPT